MGYREFWRTYAQNGWCAVDVPDEFSLKTGLFEADLKNRHEGDRTKALRLDPLPLSLVRYFFRYTFSPTFSSRLGIVTFPSVEAMMIVLPEDEGPNSLDKSTLMVSVFPSTVISTFFMKSSY
jgi:hypothetical protein